MQPKEGVFQNDRTLGEIVLSKTDLDAAKYLASGSHGTATLDGAVYDLAATHCWSLPRRKDTALRKRWCLKSCPPARFRPSL